ncbi:MAG: hypothetical protein WAM81_03395 [Acidimicrobiia bacterium]
MLRKLVLLAFLGLVLLAAFVYLGPRMPDGSWTQEASAHLRDALKAWWGFPIAGP